MKKISILIVGTLLFARLNPFVLPQSEGEMAASSLATSSASVISSSISSSSVSSTLSSSSVALESPSSRGLGSKVPKERVLKDLGFITFRATDRTLTIVTDDPLKRAFLLDSPKKAVFDFAKSRRFPTQKISTDHPHFRQIVIGAHPRYYRVVVELDSSCKPKIEDATLRLFCR